MDFLLESPMMGLVFWLAFGAVLVAVAWYIVGKIRTESIQREPTASEMMTKFRDLHAKGQLSDTEFREIKTSLAARLQAELNNSNETD